MLIDRRTLLRGTALLAFVDLLQLSTKVLARASQTSGPLPTKLGLDDSATRRVFKIAAWDRNGNPTTAHSQISLSQPAVDDTSCDEVFIKINQAWRTAWR
jgi:hypothetical protein